MVVLYPCFLAKTIVDEVTSIIDADHQFEREDRPGFEITTDSDCTLAQTKKSSTQCLPGSSIIPTIKLKSSAK